MASTFWFGGCWGSPFGRISGGAVQLVISVTTLVDVFLMSLLRAASQRCAAANTHRPGPMQAEHKGILFFISFYFFRECREVYCAKPQCRTLCLVPHSRCGSIGSIWMSIGTVVTLMANGVAEQTQNDSAVASKSTKVQRELVATWAQFNRQKWDFETDLAFFFFFFFNVSWNREERRGKVASRHLCLR